jgi:hypothetical protein
MHAKTSTSIHYAESLRPYDVVESFNLPLDERGCEQLKTCFSYNFTLLLLLHMYIQLCGISASLVLKRR